MDIKKLKQFLENFTLTQEDIINFLNNKKIIEKNNNYYLIEKDMDFKPNQVFQNNLIFIKLCAKEPLPSMYLLEFLKSQTKSIRMKSPKQAINFTYGKDLHVDSIIRRRDFIEKKYYILTSNDDILGYIQLDSKQRFACKNIMNIGEYLKEN